MASLIDEHEVESIGERIEIVGKDVVVESRATVQHDQWVSVSAFGDEEVHPSDGYMASRHGIRSLSVSSHESTDTRRALASREVSSTDRSTARQMLPATSSATSTRRFE